MKLAISNIGWEARLDEAVYSLMKEYGFAGLEIAPTRIFPDMPYEKCREAAFWARKLKAVYGFEIPSMQSIWFGRKERIFGTEEERRSLLDYTKKAIAFATAIGCYNLVFGCPRNRNVPEETKEEVVKETELAFFQSLGEYAAVYGITIGMEANPPIYHTNYLNETKEAITLIEKAASPGLGLNLDIGTMLQNEEPAEEIVGRVKHISHVHISEPDLKPIERRKLHGQLRDILEAEGYAGFVSIEMGRQDDLQLIERTMRYVKEVFG